MCDRSTEITIINKNEPKTKFKCIDRNGTRL